MLTKMSRRIMLCGCALTVLLAACVNREGPYPSREIKLIVQASPGGLSDTVSRFMASLLEKDLGVPVVCENKPGASGALAFSYVTRRPPDGYTIAHAPVEIAMVRTLGYAEVGPEDMSLVCLVSKAPPVLVVREDSPWRTLAEFLDAARAKPGEIVMANSGTGSIWHFNTLLMEQACDVRVTHLPYSGSSGSLASLLGGHVDAVIAGAGEAVSNVKAGSLRVLAVLDRERSQLFPEAPTTHELGFPLGAPAWSGFFAPRGLPDEIQSKLEQAFRHAFQSPEWAALCRERGLEPEFLTSAEFSYFAAEQTDFFAEQIPRLLRMRR